MRTSIRKVHPTVLLVIGSILFSAGVWLAYWVGKPILEKAQASSHWPGTTGTIQTSRVVESRGSKGRRRYSAEVKYVYTVGDRSYSGDTLWFGDGCKSSSPCQPRATVQRYRPGSRVTVYYDFDHPEVAVLQPGVNRSSYGLYSMGWLFMGLGCALNVMALVKRSIGREQVPGGFASGTDAEWGEQASVGRR